MTTTAPPVAVQDEKGTFRLATGAGLGLAAAVVAIVIPIAFVLLATYNPGGFFVLVPRFVELTSVLVLAGAILFILSLFFYRRSFSALRKVDARFTAASVLCLIGSLGFLLLLVAAAVVVGNSSQLLACVHGQPSHALTCLRSGEPLGAYTALAGFWLGWLGGVGIVAGLFLAQSRFQRGAYGAGGVLYSLLLLILIGPFVALVVAIPGIEYLLLTIPVLTIAAPALVLAAGPS